MTKETIQIIKPDDWHLHLRDGALLESAVPYTARRNARAIVMPNLVPPVINVTLANAYKQRILNCLEPGSSTFTPLMTMYLTESTSPEDIYESIGHVHALKWYPAGATTNSDSGVRDINNCYEVLQVMEAKNIPLLIHGEVTDKEIDIFDREAVFIERHLKQIINDFPKLKIVLEHITTQQAAEFVASAPDNVAATITVHHLLLNRNAMLGTLSHTRRILNPLPPGSKSLGPRKLHNSQYGFVCPTESPDGGNVGIINHLSIVSKISFNVSESNIYDALTDVGLISLNDIISNDIYSSCKVFLNGKWIGIHKDPEYLYKIMRLLKYQMKKWEE